MDNQQQAASAVIAPEGRINAGDILTLRHRSETALVAGIRTIAVDLRAASHIDTGILAELAVVLRAIGRQGLTFAVVGADERIEWVLRFCDIEGVEFHPTLRRALVAARSGRPSARHRRYRATVRRRRPSQGRTPPPS